MVPLVSSVEEKKPAHALVVQSPENPSGAFCLSKSILDVTPEACFNTAILREREGAVGRQRIFVQGLDTVCAGPGGTTRTDSGGFVGLNWGLLGPWRGFQSVINRQSAKQIHRSAICLRFVPPPESGTNRSFARIWRTEPQPSQGQSTNTPLAGRSAAARAGMVS